MIILFFFAALAISGIAIFVILKTLKVNSVLSIAISIIIPIAYISGVYFEQLLYKLYLKSWIETSYSDIYIIDANLFSSKFDDVLLQNVDLPCCQADLVNTALEKSNNVFLWHYIDKLIDFNSIYMVLDNCRDQKNCQYLPSINNNVIITDSAEYERLVNSYNDRRIDNNCFIKELLIYRSRVCKNTEYMSQYKFRIVYKFYITDTILDFFIPRSVSWDSIEKVTITINAATEFCEISNNQKLNLDIRGCENE